VIAVILTRAAVPLYLFSGAVLKLADGSPTHLPAALIKWLGAFDVDLTYVLHFSIASELTVAGVMVLVPGIARWTGVVMLGAFIPVLLGDVLMGASSCGCFGAVEIHPGITLVIDFGLFLGVLLLGRGVSSLRATVSQPTIRVVAAGVWAMASFALAFYPAGGARGASASVAGGAALPEEGYYVPHLETWVGQPWSDVPISKWIRGNTDDLTAGNRYVLFYRKDCEHCHELMEVFFSGTLTIPTTAVAVPEKSGFPKNPLPFPCKECGLAELPGGVDWFLQTPVLVRLENGVVVCASETTAEDPVCVDFAAM